jgi:hypothetical protein
MKRSEAVRAALARRLSRRPRGADGPADGDQLAAEDPPDWDAPVERYDTWADGELSADTLRTVGPFVTHLTGRVIAVTDAGPGRPAPSVAPLWLSLLVMALVLVAPVAVRFLPEIAFALSLVLMLWSRPLLRGLRRRRAPAPTLRKAAFRVRLSADVGAGVGPVHRDVDCRLVLRDETEAPLLLGGERVVGRGRFNWARTTLHLRELRIESPTRRYRASFPRSSVPVLLTAAATLGLAAVFYRARSDDLLASADHRLWLVGAAAVLPVFLVGGIRLAARRRRRRERSRRGRR